MKDKPPLRVTSSLGALRPKDETTAAAINAISGKTVEIKIVKGSYNLSRLGFYWVMLSVASKHLSDRLEDPIDAEGLHRLLKYKLKLGKEIVLPSGEKFFDFESINVVDMPEHERARWVDRCAHVLSKWLGVEVTTLMDEARAA